MPRHDDRTHRTFLFGPFRLSTSKRVLFEGDRVVRLGTKAIEILIALVERAGELVSKHELVEIAWPDTTVVEANLTVQVAALRRALGEDESANQYIVNSPGRGYRFVAPIRIVNEHHPVVDAPSVPAHNLPAQLTRLIGRADELPALRNRLTDSRLLSIVGPPGIGKTSIAIQLSEAMLPQFRDGVWLVDLSSITNASLIPSVLAAALPIDVRSSDVLSGIVTALRYKNLLLVFDNCEHLIDAAAAAISGLLHGTRDVTILTTSREALRIEGERVYRLSSLAVPPASGECLAKDVLGFPAVQLFVERAGAITGNFELSDANAAFAAEICRKLDGNPLAIELAAARVDAFGVKGLAARLDDRMHLLTEPHRGVPMRHRTITAALDWSYQLLSEREQYVLRCLGIFGGSFTLEAAIAVIPPEEGTDTAAILADLVCKSLLSVEIGSDAIRFRLPEITKAFALAKLIETSERRAIAIRLSACIADMLKKCAEGPHRVQAARDAVHELDNVRGVLNWALSPDGATNAGVALAAAAVPVWLENALLTECVAWTSRAIDVLDARIESQRDEMLLKAAFGLAVMFTQGMTSQSRAALDRAIELAAHLGDRQWELRARLGLILFLHRRGDLKGALEGTKRVEALIADVDDPTALAMLKSVKSASLYFDAQYTDALKLAREAHAYFRTHSNPSQIGRWGLNHSIYAQCVMAGTHWCEGRFDETIRVSQAVHAEAEATGNPTSICQALSWCGCNLFLRMEELDLAEVAISRMRQVALDNDIQSYALSAVGFQGRLHFLKGEFEPAERLLREAISRLGDARYENLSIPFLGRLGELLAADGRAEEAVLASAESLAKVRATEAFWLLPDALRIHGVALRSLEGLKSASAESHFREAIAISQRQGAIGYELKAAENCAAMLHGQGRTDEAIALLDRALGQFVEGFEIVLVRRARSLLEEMRKVANAPDRSVEVPGAPS